MATVHTARRTLLCCRSNWLRDVVPRANGNIECIVSTINFRDAILCTNPAATLISISTCPKRWNNNVSHGAAYAIHPHDNTASSGYPLALSASSFVAVGPELEYWTYSSNNAASFAATVFVPPIAVDIQCSQPSAAISDPSIPWWA